MSHNVHLAAPLVGKQSLAVKLDRTRETGNKGPVVRKSVEAFYFAAHAYQKLHDVGLQSGPEPTRDANCKWIPVPGHMDAKGEKLAGLFSVWYPEVSTLVLAYAGSDTLMKSMTPGSQGDAFNKSVFYLPSAWQATARSNFAELLHDLHAPPSSHGASPSATLKAANEQLRSLSNSCDPLRVVVCGFATGGALASLAAPYVALAYSSADTRLITYGAPEVRSSEFVRLTEWAVGVRLRVVQDGDEVCSLFPETKRPGTELPPVNIRLSDDDAKKNKNISSHSLEAYLLGLDHLFRSARSIETSGTPFTDTGDGYAAQIKEGAKVLRGSNYQHNAALEWASNLDFHMTSGQINGPWSRPTISEVDPAYVAEAFSFIPGPLYMSSMDTFLQCLAIAVMKQSGLYCVGAYAANVIPRDFINFSEFPLQGDNIALVSDPFSGADVYVGWSESSQTLLFAFRGTEIYEGADILTDINIFASPANVFQEVDTSKKACKSTSSTPVLSDTKNDLVHSGFLGQFQALTGMQLFSWRDLKRSPFPGLVRGVRAGLLYLLGMNSPLGMNPNIAEVAFKMMKSEDGIKMKDTAHKVSGGKTPLRVLCCGHSLGGALATIAALWAGLTYPSADIRCITFGSPLVGNADFVLDWRQVVGTRIRAVNGEDPVPSVPPRIGLLTPCTHVYPAVWLRRGPPARVEVYETELKRPWFDFRDARSWTLALLGRLNILDHPMGDGYYQTMVDAEQVINRNRPNP